MNYHPRLVSLSKRLIRQNSHFASIQLVIGELFPLSETQLRADWSELTKDTALAQAVLKIRIIRAEQQCMVCFQKYHPVKNETACPGCGSVGAKILAGEECFIESSEASGE